MRFSVIIGGLLVLLAVSIVVFVYPPEQIMLAKERIRNPATYDDRTAISLYIALGVIISGIGFLVDGLKKRGKRE